MEKKTVIRPSTPVATGDKSECVLLVSVMKRAAARDPNSISVSRSVPL